MRQFVAAVSLVALAACGGTKEEEAPEPVETVPATATPEPSPSPTGSEGPEPAKKSSLKLMQSGFTVGDKVFAYETSRSQVEASLEALLGAPTGRNGSDECGAGPMNFTDYPGGVTVNFQDDKLVGWNWRSPQDGDAPAKAKISTNSVAQLGTAKATVEAASGFSLFEDSTLGEEFQLGETLFGFFEAGKVSMLYSGTQCFFR